MGCTGLLRRMATGGGALLTPQTRVVVSAAVLALAAGCSGSGSGGSSVSDATAADAQGSVRVDAGHRSSSASSSATRSTAATRSSGSRSTSSTGGGSTEERRDGGTSHAGSSDAAAMDATPGDAGDASLPGWTLVWSDEFNGTALDTSVWNATPTGNGGYNQELQYFNAPGTVVVSGGYLHIVALTLNPDGGAPLSCWYGNCQYASAQLDTSGKFSHQYGRFAARMKIPGGSTAFWPAFWMLGNSPGWPVGGEIDVMENVGDTPAVTYGTIHGPTTADAAFAYGGTNTLASGDLSDDFHVYAVEWSENQILFSIDGQTYFTAAPSGLDAGQEWVWNNGPFYLLLDLAIGGDWPGNPTNGIPEPSELLVDWVRVYDPD